MRSKMASLEMSGGKFSVYCQAPDLGRLPRHVRFGHYENSVVTL